MDSFPVPGGGLSKWSEEAEMPPLLEVPPETICSSPGEAAQRGGPLPKVTQHTRGPQGPDHWCGAPTLTWWESLGPQSPHSQALSI